MQKPNKPRTVRVQFKSTAPNDAPKNIPPHSKKISTRPAQKALKAAPSQQQRPVSKAPNPQGAQRPKLHRSAQKRAESRAELNRKLSVQTPAGREQVRRVKKVGGSSKNIEIKRHANSSRQKFYVKKKRANLMKLLAARLVLFLIVFAVMFGIVAGIFTMSLKAGGVDEGREYTLQLGEDKPADDISDYEPEYVTIPEGCAERNGTVYIPVSALIDLCSLTVTGSSESLRYIPRDSDGHTMSFESGSNLAYVNGRSVRMNAEAFTSDGKLYVPLKFFTDYSDGIIITEDHANTKITIARMNTGYDALTDSKIYAPLRFKAASTDALEPMPEPID